MIRLPPLPMKMKAAEIEQKQSGQLKSGFKSITSLSRKKLLMSIRSNINITTKKDTW